MRKYDGIDNASLLHPLCPVSWVSSVSQSPVSPPSRCLGAAAELGAGEPRAAATTITASTFLCSLHQTDNSSADTQSRPSPLSFVTGIKEEYLIHTMDYQEKNYVFSHHLFLSLLLLACWPPLVKMMPPERGNEMEKAKLNFPRNHETPATCLSGAGQMGTWNMTYMKYFTFV